MPENQMEAYGNSPTDILNIFELFKTYSKQTNYTTFYQFKFDVDKPIKIVGLLVGLPNYTKSITVEIKSNEDKSVSKTIENIADVDCKKIMIVFDVKVSIKAGDEYTILLNYNQNTYMGFYTWDQFGALPNVTTVVNDVRFNTELSSNVGLFIQILFV